MRKLVRQREEEWRAKQARVQGAALDVTDDPALKKWVDGFAAEGGIDHFVANVSALGTDDTPEGWRKAIDIDIVSTVEFSASCHAASAEEWRRSSQAPPAPSSAQCRWSRRPLGLRNPTAR